MHGRKTIHSLIKRAGARYGRFASGGSQAPEVALEILGEWKLDLVVLGKLGEVVKVAPGSCLRFHW